MCDTEFPPSVDKIKRVIKPILQNVIFRHKYSMNAQNRNKRDLLVKLLFFN